MPNELQAGMLAYSGFWSLLKWFFNPLKFNIKATKSKSDLVAQFDFTKFRAIDYINISDDFKAGFYNQKMPAELIEQLKLE